MLGLTKEPFSTSPDPQFFYPSLSHDAVLKRLEISIRLRRGLNLILGDVGTGKTTLLRALSQQFNDESDFVFHIILDPGFKSEYQFLLSLAGMFGIKQDFKSTLDFKGELEKYLFRKGVEENKTIILLIDEGQKITSENIEVLRTLLNFETNEYKLLQLVIMAQIELLPRIKRIRNFFDRIALKYIINPLDRSEVRELIHFRLHQAGYQNEQPLFTDEAIGMIYEYTQGYPRRVVVLCHDALEAIVMKERYIVDAQIIKELITQGSSYAE